MARSIIIISIELTSTLFYPFFILGLWLVDIIRAAIGETHTMFGPTPLQELRGEFQSYKS